MSNIWIDDRFTADVDIEPVKDYSKHIVQPAT